ncbi:MAG: carboxypeptidase regulatory-like domain-containing protein [Planctomycetes bacterium]|nr:carboxypeptidase regulatory-like domain-containing protein [Planctomycetota bacterium]
MLSFASKLLFPLAALAAAGLVYFALFAGEAEGPATPREQRLASPRELAVAPAEDLRAPAVDAAPAVDLPEEAALSIELAFEKVGEIDRSAEERPFYGAFSGVAEGIVFDAGSAPLHGALIEVVGGPSSGRATSTSFAGTFRLEGIAPGLCDLRFSAPSEAPITRRLMVPSEGAARLEVTLTPGVSFFGKISGHDGKPIEGALVEIEGREARADAGGRWSIADVPSGNEIAVHAWAPGYARQRMQAYIPNEPAGTEAAGLVIVLLRGAKLEVLGGESFPTSAPLRVSVLPREGYASPSFPAERFFDLPSPIDGSPFVIEGLPQSFLGDVFVAHPFASPERTSFPLAIGASDPAPINVRANPASAKRARRVVAAPSGMGAGVADVVLRFEPADLAPFLRGFAGGPGEQRPQPSLAWLSAETVTRDQGRFEIDLGFPPPWRATVRRTGFAVAQQVLGADEDAVIRLLPLDAQDGRVAVVIDPARPARVAWMREANAEARELAGDGAAPLELGNFAPGIYRVTRKLQGRELSSVELRVEPGREARLALGWGRQ